MDLEAYSVRSFTPSAVVKLLPIKFAPIDEKQQRNAAIDKD